LCHPVVRFVEEWRSAPLITGRAPCTARQPAGERRNQQRGTRNEKEHPVFRGHNARQRLTPFFLRNRTPPAGCSPSRPDPSAAPARTATLISFERIAIDLEGAPLESVTVEVEVANVGNLIPDATLILEVTRNRQLVDEIAIAKNVALADGVTSFSTTYTPEGGFGSGLVSFRLRLDAIAPDGTATLLIQSGTVAKIDVP